MPRTVVATGTRGARADSCSGSAGRGWSPRSLARRWGTLPTRATMPEAVAAILLRFPFMAASGGCDGLRRMVSLLIRVGTCFITAAGPSVAAAWAPCHGNSEK